MRYAEAQPLVSRRPPGHREIPLYRDIASQLGKLIARGSYRPGDRIPSTRELSRKLGVGINTIMHAYELLESGGLIEARPQSGYYVSLARPKAFEGAPAPVSVGHLPIEVMLSLADERLVPLGRGAPSPDLLPVGKLSRILAGQARSQSAECASYAPRDGVKRLRQQIAKRSLDYGCAFAPDQIVITSGCVEAVTLALHATCAAGDTVMVESPVYYTFLNSIQQMGLKVLEIPSTPNEGINLDVLAYALEHNRVQACLVISNFGNPLGGLMPDEKKRELVRLLARHEIVLIEDDVYGDLGFGRVRPPAFQAYDENGLVLLCSSFSKTVAPGYRVGWIAPGKFLNRVRALKSLFNLSSATPTQLAIAEFLSSGGYDRHLRATCRILRDRIGRMRDCVSRQFPAGTVATMPAGGYFLWLEMPAGIDGFSLYERCLRQGIGIAPGTLFTASGRFRNCVRLNCSYWSREIEQAVATAGRLARASRTLK